MAASEAGTRSVDHRSHAPAAAPRLDAPGPGRRARPCPPEAGKTRQSPGTSWTVVEGMEHDDFARSKIEATTQELVEERDEVRELLGS